MDIRFRRETWPLRTPFRISGYVFHAADVGVVELRDGPFLGRGEACGALYKNDDIAAIEAGVASVAEAVRAGCTRDDLQSLLPDCGARNAVDCALWELEAQKAGVPVWRLAGGAEPRPLLTTYTIGAEDPGVMAERAVGFSDAKAIKLKLTGADCDAERVRAVRAVRPDVWLGVDANQAFTPAGLDDLMATLVGADVKLIEQPFAIGREADLRGLASPIPLAADESAQITADLAGLVGLVEVINIKLDKCGGLTHGLAMAAEARRLGFQLMVGNMTGTSWAQAPAFVIGQQCQVVDLDGPLLLAADRMPGASYVDGMIWCSEEVWGGASALTPAHSGR